MEYWLVIICGIIFISAIIFRFNFEKPFWLALPMVSFLGGLIILKIVFNLPTGKIFLYLILSLLLGFGIKELGKLIKSFFIGLWEAVLSGISRPRNSLIISLLIFLCVFYLYNKELFLEAIQVTFIAAVIASFFWKLVKKR